MMKIKKTITPLLAEKMKNIISIEGIEEIVFLNFKDYPSFFQVCQWQALKVKGQMIIIFPQILDFFMASREGSRETNKGQLIDNSSDELKSICTGDFLKYKDCFLKWNNFHQNPLTLKECQTIKDLYDVMIKDFNAISYGLANFLKRAMLLDPRFFYQNQESAEIIIEPCWNGEKELSTQWRRIAKTTAYGIDSAYFDDILKVNGIKCVDARDAIKNLREQNK